MTTQFEEKPTAEKEFMTEVSLK